MATWDESGIRPDHRDESPGYDPPTPADEGYDAAYEARVAKWWAEGAHTRPDEGGVGHGS